MQKAWVNARAAGTEEKPGMTGSKQLLGLNIEGTVLPSKGGFGQFLISWSLQEPEENLKIRNACPSHGRSLCAHPPGSNCQT